MAAKKIFVICAFALWVKLISAQSIGVINTIPGALAAEELALANNALAYGATMAARGNPLAGCNNYGLSPNSFVPSSGGAFAVTSYSPIAPTGVTVFSENAIEGALAVNGELPFLGAIALEGALPSAGAGGINYGCGSGAIGIVSEGVAPGMAPYGAPGVGPYGPMAPAAGIAPGRPGFGPGLAAPGFAGLGAPGLGAPAMGLNPLAGPKIF